MDLETMKARLTEIHAKLGSFEALETLTSENMTEIEALSTEFDNLENQIKAKEILAKRKTVASTGRQVAPVAVVEAKPVAVKNGGFENAGSFFMAVKETGLGKRDQRFDNTMFEKNGDEGGFLVPEEFMSEIVKKISGDESLLSKTRQFTISGNSLTLPTDEITPWTGGVQAYWTAEGAPIQDSKTKIGMASWRLNKLAAMVKLTDELADDAVALESYVKAMAPEAISYKLNEAILVGDGNGKPSGILNSPFRVVVAKESGQTANTVVTRNIVKMYAKMLPSSRRNAVWYINAAVEPELMLLKDDNGNFIYLAPGSQLNQSPYGLLLGRPVIPMLASLPELGAEGDIVFADLSYYYTILKSGGMKNSASTHLYFDRDITAFKFTMRIDGNCPFKSPVTVEHGNYEMSGFVTLADR